MPFDSKRFMREKWQPRTAAVQVPELADLFDEGETPVWTVRSLSGTEIAKSADAEQKFNAVKKIAETLSKNAKAESASDVLEMLGVGGDEVPAELAKRIEHLIFASVEPKCDRSMAVRLFDAHPVVAFQLTNKILELTGLGAEPGKPKASTHGKTSKSH